jgi:hypothetical protein
MGCDGCDRIVVEGENAQRRGVAEAGIAGDLLDAVDAKLKDF